MNNYMINKNRWLTKTKTKDMETWRVVTVSKEREGALLAATIVGVNCSLFVWEFQTLSDSDRPPPPLPQSLINLFYH